TIPPGCTPEHRGQDVEGCLVRMVSGHRAPDQLDARMADAVGQRDAARLDLGREIPLWRRERRTRAQGTEGSPDPALGLRGIEVACETEECVVRCIIPLKKRRDVG